MHRFNLFGDELGRIAVFATFFRGCLDGRALPGEGEPSGNEQFAAREGAHDDLLAVALACRE